MTICLQTELTKQDTEFVVTCKFAKTIAVAVVFCLFGPIYTFWLRLQLGNTSLKELMAFCVSYARKIIWNFIFIAIYLSSGFYTLEFALQATI